MHGATNSKGDRTTFAVFRATPVVLAQIVKRLTANGTKFRGGVLVCQCSDGRELAFPKLVPGRG
jgi:hypothetical protein